MSETGNGRKNWTRVVAAVGLVFLAVAIALLIGLLFGIVQGFLVSYLEIQPFIVSLAGMFFGRGMTSIISTDMISIKNKTFLAWANYKIYLPIGIIQPSWKIHSGIHISDCYHRNTDLYCRSGRTACRMRRIPLLLKQLFRIRRAGQRS